MKRLSLMVLVLAAFVMLTLSSSAMADNVALYKSVALNGTFFTDADGWGSGVVSPAGRIVNGIFAGEMTQWNVDGVWWNGSIYPENNIVIDLGGTYEITSFIVQADNNDTYRLSYQGVDEGWYDVVGISGWGLMTRPEYFLGSPILATQLKFVATSGDGYYSVSQIVANGRLATSTPEPATLMLLGLGLLGLTGIRRKLQK